MPIHMKFMFWAAVVAVAAPFALSTAPARAAEVKPELQEKVKPQYGISDKTLTQLMSIAWALLPEEIDAGNGKKITFDKSDLNEYIIPAEDARRVVRYGYLSAQAQICNLPDAYLANFLTLMNSEKDSGKWTRKQLHFIKWLHNATLQVMVGDQGPPGSAAPDKTAEASKDADKKGSDKAAPADAGKGKSVDTGGDSKMTAKAEAKPDAPAKETCTAEKRKEVQKEIADFVEQANKS